MSGSTHVHEEQRIFLAHRIRIFDFAEEFSGVGELRLEFAFYFLPNFVAALLNPGANRGNNIFGPGAVFASHQAQPFFRNARYRATPAGVKCSHSFVFCICQQDRKTVSGEDAERDSGDIGDESITGKSFLGKRGDDVNDVRVDLAQRDQIRRCPEYGEKTAAVELHALARFVRDKAEASIRARAEAVN